MDKIYKININYSIFVNKSMELCSIISCVNEDIVNLLEKRARASYIGINENLKDITKISLINKEIEKILKEIHLPNYLIFVLDEEDKYNGDYVYLKEVFSGKKFLVDATLLNVTKINRLKAHILLFQYSLEEIESIKNIMESIDFDMEEESLNQNTLKKKKAKIIKFPN